MLAPESTSRTCPRPGASSASTPSSRRSSLRGASSSGSGAAPWGLATTTHASGTAPPPPCPAPLTFAGAAEASAAAGARVLVSHPHPPALVLAPGHHRLLGMVPAHVLDVAVVGALAGHLAQVPADAVVGLAQAHGDRVP